MLVKIAATALFALSASAQAASFLVVDCKVKDANGRTLYPNEQSAERVNDHLVMTASSSRFSYRVELVGEVGDIELVDKRYELTSKAEDVRFEVAREVALDLLNAVEPAASLKMTCLSRRQRW